MNVVYKTRDAIANNSIYYGVLLVRLRMNNILYVLNHRAKKSHYHFIFLFLLERLRVCQFTDESIRLQKNKQHDKNKHDNGLRRMNFTAIKDKQINELCYYER